MSSDANGLGLDITMIASGATPPLPGGAELAALAEALTIHLDREPAAERTALVEAIGLDAAERAIGVGATFQMMNRLLDGVGAPIRRTLHGLAAELGFDPAELR